MPIVSSTFTLGVPQVDARVNVTEIHTAQDGSVYRFEYLNDGQDTSAVMAERASLLNAQLAARDAVSLAVHGTVLPLTVYSFLNLIPQPKRTPILIAAKTDINIEDFMLLLTQSGGVYRTDPNLSLGLGYLQQQGLLGADDIATIMAAQ